MPRVPFINEPALSLLLPTSLLIVRVPPRPWTRWVRGGAARGEGDFLVGPPPTGVGHSVPRSAREVVGDRDLPGPGLRISGRDTKPGTGSLIQERGDGSLLFSFPATPGVVKAPAPALSFMYLCKMCTPAWRRFPSLAVSPFRSFRFQCSLRCRCANPRDVAGAWGAPRCSGASRPRGLCPRPQPPPSSGVGEGGRPELESASAPRGPSASGLRAGESLRQV